MRRIVIVNFSRHVLSSHKALSERSSLMLFIRTLIYEVTCLHSITFYIIIFILLNSSHDFSPNEARPRINLVFFSLPSCTRCLCSIFVVA